MTTSYVMIGAGPDLQVVFDRRGDRWGHRIELLRDGELLVAVESIEGAAADAWPPSPAFQTLDVQSIAGRGQTALLVGKAGTSHWSAAIEADSVTETLRFDIACRAAHEPLFLGSSYSIVGEIVDARQRVLPNIDLADESADCRAALEVRENRLVIRVRSLVSDLPNTSRWVYTVSRRRTADSETI